MSQYFLELIRLERERQKSLPGSEYDVMNTPNDWITIVSKYLTEGCRYKGIDPLEKDFVDSFVKAGAIILAALEHTENMSSKKRLRK